MKQGTIDDLIKQHEGLIFFTLSNFNCIKTPEVISAAYEALWRAIETFDSERGAEFSTYAVKCIRNAAYDEMRQFKEQDEMEVLLENAELINSYDTYEEVEDDTTDYTFLYKAVDDTLDKLSGKKLIVAKLWMDSRQSVTAIAKEANCSQSYASQAIKEFKASLRKELKNAGYSFDSTNNRADK